MAKGLWVVLNVASVDKSLEFYEGLGLKATREQMGGIEFASVGLGPIEAGIVLWPKDAIAPDQPADTKAWLSGELGKGVLFSFGVPNARKAWEKAGAMRANVETPLREQEWGGWEFTLIDPDGFVVNVTDKFPGPPPAKKRAKPKARKAVAKKAKGAKRRR
jgi:catechol 2,3-dioxygenase-like lactoylglutathione lyase family enzyme